MMIILIQRYIMKLFVFYITVLVLAFVASGAPVSRSEVDVTGQQFETSCGDVGIFISGVFHQGFRTECTAPNPETFTCRLDSFFNFSNAEVSIDGVIWKI